MAGTPLYLFRRLAMWILRWMVAIGSSKRFSCKVKVWTYAGQILEHLRQARRGSKTSTSR